MKEIASIASAFCLLKDASHSSPGASHIGKTRRESTGIVGAQIAERNSACCRKLKEKHAEVSMQAVQPLFSLKLLTHVFAVVFAVVFAAASHWPRAGAMQWPRRALP